jgi:hypothetical protein
MSTPKKKVIDKIPKQRKCLLKSCKQKFTPLRNNQAVCSPICAYKYAEANKEKNWKKRKSEQKDTLKTHSDWSRELQIEINTIVRLIDKGSVCVSSLKPLNEKYDAGHRFSTGAFPSLRFHLDNIHAQSVNQNQYMSGNPDGYDHGLECLYGEQYLTDVWDLRLKYSELKLTIPELVQAKSRAKKIVAELKKADLCYPPKMRIELRKKYNERLKIYS